MRNMGKYSKAYPIGRFREFPGWKEEAQNARKEAVEVDGKQVEGPRRLTEDDYLFLQEDFTVTDGIFLEENIIFDRVTPEWKEFCAKTLEFEVPNYETAAAAEAGSDNGQK